VIFRRGKRDRNERWWTTADVMHGQRSLRRARVHPGLCNVRFPRRYECAGGRNGRGMHWLLRDDRRRGSDTGRLGELARHLLASCPGRDQFEFLFDGDVRRRVFLGGRVDAVGYLTCRLRSLRNCSPYIQPHYSCCCCCFRSGLTKKLVFLK